MSDSHDILEPDALFVIACPVCLGQIAATGSLCGHDACCPLCANLFHVPVLQAAALPGSPPAPEPPRPKPSPGLAEDWGGVIRKLTPPPKEPGPAAENMTPVTTEFELLEDTAESAEPAVRVSPDDPVSPAADGLPMVGGTPLDPAATELIFSEPVRTVRHGETVIEIRRLTPEERRARRFRRNVLMVVVGVSILLAIVLVFGVPQKP